ncbi:MAG: CHASE2 domain-containing protein [Cyanobacteria bacterium P01_F01_bin.150]
MLTSCIHYLGIFQVLELHILDYWLRSRPLEPHRPPIVIVSIDDNDIATHGGWPLTDNELAQLLTRIKTYDPAAIGLNLYRDLPIGSGQDQLEQFFRDTPNLIGIEKVVGEGASPAIAPSPTLDALGQVAFNDLVLDRDGNVRRHLLSLRHDQQTKFALGTALALLYLEQEAGITPQPLADERIILGQTEYAPLHKHAGAYYGADTGGYQILANYLRPDQGIPTVSMQDVFDNRIPADLMQQKVVLIGLKADSSWGDRFFTPYSISSNQSWSGVEIHANLAAQLIIGAIDGRPPLRPLPDPVELIWALLWISLGVAMNRALSLSWQYWLSLPGLMGIILGTTYLVFLGNYWIPLLPALVGYSGAWVLTQGYLVYSRLQQETQRLEQTVQSRTQELQQQNQALEQAQIQANLANQAKSRFLAHISHELRTPLTAILGFGDLLERSPHLPTNEKDYAATINRSGKHLLALINNVLELSKIETNSAIVTIESVNLSTLLSDLQHMFQPQAMGKNLEIRLHLADNVPHWIDIDGSKLRQILINLLGNAIKFTEAGQVSLNVEIDANTQDFLEFTVEDTGPGITSTEIDCLFQPFVQTTSGKKMGKGTGLGLALSRQCVELIGGTIGVTSQVNKGSRFFFKIPFQPTDPSIHQAELISLGDNNPIPHFPSDYRILIVDNETNIQRLLTQWLASAQCVPQTANNGLEALQVFKQWHPHLILLDIHLPDVNGYEVARRIRSMWETHSLIPEDDSPYPEDPIILAVTAGVLQDNYADLLAAGCDDVIWKPIQAETFFSKITEHCIL